MIPEIVAPRIYMFCRSKVKFSFQSVTHKDDGSMTEVAIDFATYGTKPSGDRSGAYLFLPDGPAEVSAFWSVAGQCTQSQMKMS